MTPRALVSLVCLLVAAVLTAAPAPAPLLAPDEVRAMPLGPNDAAPFVPMGGVDEQDQRIAVTLLGRGGQQPHIAVPAFLVLTADSETQDAARLVTDVLTNDLKFEREFDVMPAASFTGIPSAQAIEALPFDQWTARNADFVVLGSVQKSPEGFQVDVRVVSVKERRQVFGASYRGATRSSRRFAHRASDEIHKQLRGVDGVAQTQIAFASTRDGERIGKTVQERSAREIYIMDYDGANQVRVTPTRNLSIAPSWCPGATCLLYTSYSSNYPDLVLQNLYGQVGSTRPARGTDTVQNYFGDISPDGTRLAVASARNGAAMDIYVINRDGSGLRQLTNHPAIDSSPRWSPAGTQLAFVSDRSGSPRIYTMSADGGQVTLVPTACGRCDRPTWGPAQTGILLAYTSQTGPAVHDIELYDFGAPAESRIRRLTNGEGTNESPSFSPNGRHVVFFTTRWGKAQLAVVDIDGKNVRRLTELGDNTYPSWSGYRQ